MSQSKKWHCALSVNDVPLGAAKKVCIKDIPIAIYHIGDAFYATHNTCTHDTIGLCEGYIEGETIECPAHQAVFHIPTGKVLQAPAKTDIQVFPVRVSNGIIEIEV